MTQSLPSPNPSGDYSRKWFVMTAVGAGIFLATVDSSIINVSLPTLVKDLQTNFTVIQWVVMGYLLTVTTLMPSFGRLADMVGKKSIYMLGFIIFTAASALCGLSPGVYWLIGFRVLQGMGAAMIMALGAAIVTEAFPPHERGKAMGIVGAIVSIGIVLGPPLGGLIISTASWRWIFYVNLPTGIAGTLMVWRFLPAVAPQKKQTFDYAGASTLCISLLGLLLGLTWGQQHGFSHPVSGLLLIVCPIFLALFIRIELRVAQPMIQLGLFRNYLLSINLLNGFLVFACMGGIYILIPFYLQVIMGFIPYKVGMLMGIVPVMLGICSPLAGTWSDRIGARPVTLVGIALLILGYLALSTLDLDTTAWGYVLRSFTLGMGIGFFISPNNSAIMGAAPREHLGIVSGMMAVTRTMGQTVGIAVIGTLWTTKVKFYSAGLIAAGTTKAPFEAQVKALQDSFLYVCGIMGIVLLVSLYGYLKERQRSLPNDGTQF